MSSKKLHWMLPALLLLALVAQAQESQNCSVLEWRRGGEVRAAEVLGDYVICGEGANLQIVDLQGPHPFRVASLAMPALVEGILVDGNLAYVACGHSGIRSVRP